MEKNDVSFLLMSFILLFAVISFILIVFELHRFAFVFELMILLVFIFLLAFSMFIIYHNRKWGWTILGAALILLLVNTFFIVLLSRAFETAHLTTVFFSIIGLVVVLVNLRGIKSEGLEEGHDKFDYYPYIDKMEPEQHAKEQTKIKKTFTPGKFIASKKANKFHIAKCDWAKTVNKENRVWFNSREEAESKGFEADKCVV